MDGRMDIPAATFALQPVLAGRPDVLQPALVVTPALQAWAAEALRRGVGAGTETAFLGVLAEGRNCCDEGWIDQDQWGQIKHSVDAAQLDAARRLLDDGQWVVETGGKHIVPAERPFGFLEIRCKVHPGVPECMVVGGFEQLENGHWSADILIGPAPEEESSYKMLGEFPDREAAVLALWGHRHEVALPKEREYAIDAGIASAWQEANRLAAGKGAVVFGSVAGEQSFNGRVLSVDPVYTVQNLGRSAVIHATPALNRIPCVGEMMSCRYNEAGMAVALGANPDRGELSR